MGFRFHPDLDFLHTSKDPLHSLTRAASRNGPTCHGTPPAVAARAARPRRAASLLAAVLPLGVACDGGTQPPRAGRDLVVVSPAAGATLLGSWVDVHLEAPGFRFADPAAAAPSSARRTAGVRAQEIIEGYADAWLDRDPDTARPDVLTRQDFTLRQVPQGSHVLVVEIVDARGQRLDPPLRRSVPFRTANLLDHIEREIFVPSCALASCHGDLAPRANLRLSREAARGDLVGVDPDNGLARDRRMKRVVPFDPAASLLWIKIDAPPPEYGSLMPRSGSPLPATEKALIRRWIEQGALSDAF